MANENNNINKLVANDDDPTADMEVLSFKTSASGLRSRNKLIGRLQSDIEQLQAKWPGLEAEIDNRKSRTARISKDDLILRLNRMEEYADAIRQQSLDLIEKNTRAEREIDSLSNRLTDITGEYTQITQRLSTAASRVEELQSTLNKNQYQHEQEVDRITAKADEIEQNLTAKGETISILRAEIKKKSERSDLVGEIKEVIQDIDKQIAEGRLSDIQIKQSSSADRTCRVLICTVDDQVLRFPMFTKRLTIGRSRDNDVQIRTESVSRRHAVIQTDGDVTRIIDWGSKNGIQVNSAIVSEHFLCHGDTIIIGNARLRYEERKKRNSP